MPEPVTIYVKLLDEGTDVWRPVTARHLHGRCFLIVEEPIDDEVWEFPCNSAVICEQKRRNGSDCEIAVRLAS